MTPDQDAAFAKRIMPTVSVPMAVLEDALGDPLRYADDNSFNHFICTTMDICQRGAQTRLLFQDPSQQFDFDKRDTGKPLRKAFNRDEPSPLVRRLRTAGEYLLFPAELVLSGLSAVANMVFDTAKPLQSLEQAGREAGDRHHQHDPRYQICGSAAVFVTRHARRDKKPGLCVLIRDHVSGPADLHRKHLFFALSGFEDGRNLVIEDIQTPKFDRTGRLGPLQSVPLSEITKMQSMAYLKITIGQMVAGQRINANANLAQANAAGAEAAKSLTPRP